MEIIKQAIEHMWKDHKKILIGAGVVVVILIIHIMTYFMKDKVEGNNLNKVGTFEKVGILDVASYAPALYML